MTENHEIKSRLEKSEDKRHQSKEENARIVAAIINLHAEVRKSYFKATQKKAKKMQNKSMHHFDESISETPRNIKKTNESFNKNKGFRDDKKKDPMEDLMEKLEFIYEITIDLEETNR